MSDSDRASFIRGCIRSCEPNTKADPLSVKWKLTDTIARVCNCICKKTADKITARMLKDLQDKSKARVQTKLKTIVTAATQACYENLFESRKKK
jgi:hypothetical protein